MGFPLAHLLAAHGFRAECAAMAPHGEVGNQPPGDLHNTPAGSSGLQQNKTEPISQSKHPIPTLSGGGNLQKDFNNKFQEKEIREQLYNDILWLPSYEFVVQTSEPAQGRRKPPHPFHSSAQREEQCRAVPTAAPALEVKLPSKMCLQLDKKLQQNLHSSLENTSSHYHITLGRRGGLCQFRIQG